VRENVIRPPFVALQIVNNPTVGGGGVKGPSAASGAPGVPVRGRGTARTLRAVG